MDKLRIFFRTSLLGGLSVILPVAVLVFIFQWLFNIITGLIRPLTNVLVSQSDLQELVASIIVLAILIGACFLIGVIIRTRIGKFLHKVVEERFLFGAPGYKMVKEIVLQLFGSQKAPLSTVALARLYGNDTKVTCFITDEHDNGWKTVFVPTGPNPTSGFIYHLPGKFVEEISIPAEDAMRSVISCGAGSRKLLQS